MFRPEHFQSEHSNRLSIHADRGAIASGKQSNVLAEASDVDTLMESLMPKGISPNKQAIIEQIILMWAAKSELDVA